MTIGGGFQALVAIALVVMLGLLLIAGYGFPVGVGLVGGALVGMSLGVAASMASARPGSRGYRVLDTRLSVGRGWVSGRGMSTAENERMQAMGLAAARVAAVDQSDLLRVIAGGASVVVGAVTVELIAVELRADGAIAHLSARTRPPTALLSHFIDATASDDRGTSYVTAGTPGGGSGASLTRYQVRIAPAPPPAAVSFDLRIERFEPSMPEAGEAPTAGPWEFRIALGGPGPEPV